MSELTLPFTRDRLGTREMCELILHSGQVALRDINAGELPFEYSANKATLVPGPHGPILEGTPRFGPGYILIKALVSQEHTFFSLINQLALRVVDARVRLDGICGNVSGGMIPGFVLKLYLSHLYGGPVYYFYAREMRKEHGSREMLVGVDNTPFIKEGMNFGDVEELVNNAQTTCNAALTLRASGFRCTHAITILDYANSAAKIQREAINLTQISLVTLPELLAYARDVGKWPGPVIDDYLSYLESPDDWAARNQEAIIRTLQQKEEEHHG
ncbi:MAG: hypothetical protein A2172_00425 [Candidatus Woykebacteria bacterium RBG_13_40_15]|uniref:Phosphoribosyltransferase domain-containing protein n=1 Tax=Candidatus Woykebacteria bacterium RBG_13_40_15 TaxID=1802593 RepID=A0A1G1W9H8_9BACT|nr:MAG: hypothetical protein A2172_00425 [Candidatus Woykebacteria bacterium RBG_13_40_15]